mgnify:CR=1 FL=1
MIACAKRVIHLFMAGAPSQLELFDHKPLLAKLEGKPLPPSVIGDQRYAFIRPDAAVLGPQFAFTRHGQSGAVLGVQGGMVQMVSHGFISAAMFLCVGVLYDRLHSRQINDYGGVVNVMPWFAAFMVFFAMANAGLPGTSGFVGEFMVILAAFQANFWYAFLAAVTLILGAAYSLWLVKRVIFGDVTNDNVRELNDINAREALVFGILAVSVLLIGLWPTPLVDLMHASVDSLLQHIQQSKIVLAGG